MVSPKIITLSIGKPQIYNWNGNVENSGIGKRIVDEVLLTKEGFTGDGVANLQFHGGPERAVCVYPFEHYAYWEKEFSTRLQPPAFGENICVTEMMEKDIYIGDIFSIGEAIIQVTQGRIPCSTISKYNNIHALLGKIIDTGYTGYFLKVLKEGYIRFDSTISLMERTQEDIHVLYANQIMFHDIKNRKAIERILKVEELSIDWKEKFNKALQNI